MNLDTKLRNFDFTADYIKNRLKEIDLKLDKMKADGTEGNILYIRLKAEHKTLAQIQNLLQDAVQ